MALFLLFDRDARTALKSPGPWIALVIMMSAAAMLLPAALGVLIAETFAIRSWVFHVANGGLSAWFGLTMGDVSRPYNLYEDPLIAVGAGTAVITSGSDRLRGQTSCTGRALVASEALLSHPVSWAERCSVITRLTLKTHTPQS